MMNAGKEKQTYLNGLQEEEEEEEDFLFISLLLFQCTVHLHTQTKIVDLIRFIYIYISNEVKNRNLFHSLPIFSIKLQNAHAFCAMKIVFVFIFVIFKVNCDGSV